MKQTTKTFKEELLNNIELRTSGNLQLFINESTELFLKAKNEDKNEVKAINPDKIVLGKFYFILYNYNGNLIWCPIFPLEYKYYNQKNILYAINLDYLPYVYKINFFNLIWLKQREIFEFNTTVKKIEEEKRIQKINFETVYNLLKKNGNYEYCITAFDMKKIKHTHHVSTTLMDRFIFITTKNLNARSMKDLYDKELNKELKEKILNIREQYQKILDEYSDDTKDYYKKLKAFEKQLKLTENENLK